MKMNRKQHFIFIYLLMNTIMSFCMTLSALLVNVGFITWPMFGETIVQSLIICNVSNAVLRLPTLGEKITRMLCRGRENTKAFPLCNSIVCATLNTLCMNTFMTLLKVGPNPAYFPAWLHGIPPLEIVSVVVSVVVSPWAVRFALWAGREKE